MSSPESDNSVPLLPRLTEEESTLSEEELTPPPSTVIPEHIEEEMTPPSTVIFEPIVSDECDAQTETHKHSSEAFKRISNEFNNLDRQGKSRLLPYLLGWMTKRDLRFYVSIRRKESQYTKETNRIIDSFNLLSECERRTLFPKVIAYFELLEYDYNIIQDDNWKTPFIQKNTE